MSESFTKLFSSILRSSVWTQPPATKLVWITMLALADRKGYVGAAIPGLAHAAGVTVEETEAAIATFLAPDPYSRSKEHEGRRIEEVERGWQILNYRKFRDMRDAEARREYERERKRQQRAASRTSGTKRDSLPQSAQADAEYQSTARSALPPNGGESLVRTDPQLSSSSLSQGSTSDVRTPKKKKTTVKVKRPEDVSQDLWDDWTAFRRGKRAPITERVLSDYRKRGAAAGMTLAQALHYHVTQGTTGFYPPKDNGRRPEREPGGVLPKMTQPGGRGKL